MAAQKKEDTEGEGYERKRKQFMITLDPKAIKLLKKMCEGTPKAVPSRVIEAWIFDVAKKKGLL